MAAGGKSSGVYDNRCLSWVLLSAESQIDKTVLLSDFFFVEDSITKFL